MNKVKSMFKTCDLFTTPFNFNVGDDKKKKSTFFGGVLTFSIFSICLFYMYYLLDLYFNNQLSPVITQIQSSSKEKNNISLQNNFFAFEMLTQGMSLSEYEKIKGKKYLKYSIDYIQWYSNNTSKNMPIPIKTCDIQDLKGFQCLDFQSVQNMDLFIDPIRFESSTFEIKVEKCIGSPDCATNQDIEDLVFDISNIFQVFTQTKHYNHTLRGYESTYKSDHYQFDPDIIIYSRINLIKSFTTVSEGLVYYFQTYTKHVIDTIRLDTFFSHTNALKRIKFNGLMILSLEMHQNSLQIEIQFPMVTDILNSFMSVIQYLLILGIIARVFGRQHTIQDINNIYFKEYYKKSALKLHRQKIKNNDMQKQNSKSTAFFQNEKSNRIINIHKNLNTSEFTYKQKRIVNVPLLQRIKLFCFGVTKEKSQNYEELCQQSIIKLSNKRMDIYEIYRDLIQIKMIVKLLLTKEQYAAIRYCGCEINFQEKLSDERKKQVQEDLNKQEQIITSKFKRKLMVKKKQAPLEIQQLDEPDKLNDGRQKTIITQSYTAQKDGTPLQQQNKGLMNQQLKKNKVANYVNEQDGSSDDNPPIQSSGQPKMLNQNKQICDVYKYTENDNDNTVQDQQSIANQKQNQKNHLEILDEIDNNYFQQIKYLDTFIEYVQNNKEKASRIDQNIFDCLVDMEEQKFSIMDNES